MAKNIPRLDRIFNKIIIDDNGCWLWTASLFHTGYGKFTEKIDGKFYTYLVHRLVYEIVIDDIPQGLVLDHLCRVRRCANPYHMEIVTLKENVLRGVGPPALNAKKTHCLNGHELSGGNLYIRPIRGTRDCKICKYERNKLIYYKRQLCNA